MASLGLENGFAGVAECFVRNVPVHPPGKSSSRGSPCSGGNPLATWRTIAMISCTISPGAPPVAPLSKYPGFPPWRRPGPQTPNHPDLTLTLPRLRNAFANTVPTHGFSADR
jgi:hypothetical protein